MIVSYTKDTERKLQSQQTKAPFDVPVKSISHAAVKISFKPVAKKSFFQALWS